MLLLHGWGGRSGQMSPLAGAPVAAGCTAVAIDAPGHGRSSGRVASVPLYAGAIAAAIRELRVRAAVGHSFGGSALAFAVAHGADVGAAVIIGSPATPAVYVDRFCDELRLSSAMRGRLRARLEARVGRRFEELELIRAIAAARAPALVVHDCADREVDFSNAEALARAWPGSRLHATSGLGHRRILREPAVLADVAAFVVGRLPRCSCGRLAIGSGHGPPRCLGCALADDLSGPRAAPRVPASRPAERRPAHRLVTRAARGEVRLEEHQLRRPPGDAVVLGGGGQGTAQAGRAA